MTQEEDLKAELAQAKDSIAFRDKMILLALLLLERGDVEEAKEALMQTVSVHAARLLKKNAQP